MFAKVESGSVKELLKGNKGFTANNNQYPASVFTLWTEAERNAIGIYTVEIDNTNLKNNEYYVNTDITYAFGSGKVTGSYGTATARPIADTLFTQEDEDAGLGTKGDVSSKGLKTIKKEMLDRQCATILAPSDWRVTKEAETGSAMDSGWKTWRASVRTKCNSMQTQIDNAANVDALAALYVYNDSGVRPLGEFPIKE